MPDMANVADGDLMGTTAQDVDAVERILGVSAPRCVSSILQTFQSNAQASDTLIRRKS